MRTLRQLFKFKETACNLAVGLLLAGLLDGCTEPFVNVIVQVDTCQAGGAGKPFGPLEPQARALESQRRTRNARPELRCEVEYPNNAIEKFSRPPRCMC